MQNLTNGIHTHLISDLMVDEGRHESLAHDPSLLRRNQRLESQRLDGSDIVLGHTRDNVWEPVVDHEGEK